MHIQNRMHIQNTMHIQKTMDSKNTMHIQNTLHIQNTMHIKNTMHIQNTLHIQNTMHIQNTLNTMHWPYWPVYFPASDHMTANHCEIFLTQTRLILDCLFIDKILLIFGWNTICHLLASFDFPCLNLFEFCEVGGIPKNHQFRLNLWDWVWMVGIKLTHTSMSRFMRLDVFIFITWQLGGKHWVFSGKRIVTSALSELEKWWPVHWVS